MVAADRDHATEWALAALLPALVTRATERERLLHLLREGNHGVVLPAAERLLTVLPNH